MMRYFLFILLALLSFPALAKETVDTDTDNLDGEITEQLAELMKGNDLINYQRDFATMMAQAFDEYAASEGYSAPEFERTSSQIIDACIEQRDFIAAGVLLQKAFNILLKDYTGPNLKDLNMHYLAVSASEYYLSAGIDGMAGDWISNASEFCMATGRTSGNHWIRNKFNMATFLLRMGKEESAKGLYEEAVTNLQEIKDCELSPFTINAMLRCATEMIPHVSSRFLRPTMKQLTKSDTISPVTKVMSGVFNAKALCHYRKMYKTAWGIYDKLFNGEASTLAYKLAVYDALETAWHVGEEEYTSMLLTASHIGRDLTYLDLNSFSLNDAEMLWGRTADKLNRSFGIGLNGDTSNQFILTGAYLNSVFTKSLSTQNFHEVAKLIKESGTDKFKAVQREILELKHKMANVTDKKSRDALHNEIEKKELAMRSGINLAPLIGWNHNKSVMMPSSLEADECAVEILEYPKIENGEEITCYGAIICTSKPHTDKRLGISHRVENYEFVYLGPVIAWQLFHFGINDNFDDKTRAEQYRHDQIVSVGNLMVPLLNHIQGYKKAYVSPTGILSMINIGALPWGTGDSIVNDKVEIVRINAAYDVPDIKKRDASLRSAALFHNIDFNNSNQSNNYMTDNLGETSGYRVSIEKGGPLKKFNRLPIDGAKLLQCVKSQTKKIDNHSAAFASEEAFKKYDSNAPELIHIDTHGFFIPSSDQAFIGKHVLSGTRERALLTCGLAMSGCNHAWAGEDVPEGKEDGILTGWEISCMDLSGCKLAVLSACETAQGNVDRINGVLGLQRALKMAGVKAMLLTLWSVDNELTEEFINGFYKRLPNSANFNEAFVETQKEFRKRHPDPYHWAPFMLIN